MLLPFEATESPIERRAREFHEANPQVMSKLVEIARDLRGRGVRRIGIKLLFERLRWINIVDTQGDKYKINNNHAPWYARRIMERAEFAGLFETRDSPHDPDFHTREIRVQREVRARR